MYLMSDSLREYTDTLKFLGNAHIPQNFMSFFFYTDSLNQMQSLKPLIIDNWRVADHYLSEIKSKSLSQSDKD